MSSTGQVSLILREPWAYVPENSHMMSNNHSNKPTVNTQHVTVFLTLTLLNSLKHIAQGIVHIGLSVSRQKDMKKETKHLEKNNKHK